VRIEIKREVIEAAARLLGPGDAYDGLKLAGSEESAKKFHDDVQVVAEFVGEMAAHAIVSMGERGKL
jgi:hypothetical protein